MKERDTVQRKRKVDFPKETKKSIDVAPDKLRQIIEEVLVNFINKEDYKVHYFELDITYL